ncbi:hypothetical protein B7494_g6666 [Chlorociboria aeruginascens]|nr:hypothetical protein B7494_g6666 [Chlorociboria aeruginascens]
MAGQDLPIDAGKAMECKEKGNKCFQAGNYTEAEILYTKAILHDPTNHILYTNRAMTSLKLSSWNSVINDSQHAISLHSHNMKGYYYLAQAQSALLDPRAALQNALKAHELCKEDLILGKKDGNSLSAITSLVLKLKRERWELMEQERRNGTLLDEVLKGMALRKEERLGEVRDQGGEVGKVETEYDEKIEDVKRVFELTGLKEYERRQVPSWIIDDITLEVMIDPVVTKSGCSYDRSSIEKHIQLKHDDPVSREPLESHDLRPNIRLREAAEEYLAENGWAATY